MILKNKGKIKTKKTERKGNKIKKRLFKKRKLKLSKSCWKKGHIPWSKGKKFLNRRNEKHFAWKGDKVKYCALHDWIRRYKPKTLFCKKCHKKKRLELANISGKYKRDIKDYKWLCYKCHNNFDFPDGKKGIWKLKSFTKEHKKNISLSKRGKTMGNKNPNWKGGISKKWTKIRY